MLSVSILANLGFAKNIAHGLEVLRSVLNPTLPSNFKVALIDLLIKGGYRTVRATKNGFKIGDKSQILPVFRASPNLTQDFQIESSPVRDS